MADDFPKPAVDGAPMGATMRPQYMGRVINTYPVSESEIERISSLNGQVTARFSAASLLLGLAASIWANSIFYTEMTPAGILATYYIAPVLFLFSVCYGISGFMARRTRSTEWEKIKKAAVPVESMASATLAITRSRLDC